MDSKNKKTKVLASLIWKLMERLGAQGVSFIVQIILGRLLMPEDFGAIAIVTVFITLSNVFVQSGFNTALIQKKDADDKDFSSVFYLSTFIATMLYVLLFFTSPYIADYYSSPQLNQVLRVLAIILFFGAFNSIQNAYVARNMMFKKLFFSSTGSVIFSGIVGVIAAYLGLGVWALVLQQITYNLSVSVILWFTVKWRPRLLFSLSKVKVLFSFGWKLLASSLLNTLYMDIRTLIIGRIYNSSMLGFYNRGVQFPKLIVTNMDGAIQSVMLPALSDEQDNKKRVKEMVRRAIVTSSFLVFPMMVGLAVVAEPMIKIVLTDKWLPAAPFLQIFCASYALIPIHTANLQAINALGRSDVFLKLEIIKKVIGILILAISINFGIYAMAWGMVLSGAISSFINAYPNKKLLNYSYLEQWKDIIPSLLISLLMGLTVYVLNFLSIAEFLKLFVQIVVGVVVYILLAKLFKIECFNYLVNTAKDILGRKK